MKHVFQDDSNGVIQTFEQPHHSLDPAPKIGKFSYEHSSETLATPSTESLLEVMSSSANEEATPFFVCDLNVIKDRLDLWLSELPGVVPHYAIKCCPDRELLRCMVGLGLSFDCASMGEIETMLDLGVPPHKIIYANPTKPLNQIRYAAAKGVNVMTFDNVDELKKVKAAHPNAQMVLRILADDSKSVCAFGKKFGAHPKLAYGILEKAKELGIDVIGVSFHVGSGCFDPASFVDAVERSLAVFEMGQTLGFNFTLLDLGGGYPGLDHVDGAPFKDIAAALRPALARVPPHVRIIGEPGRYFAAPSFTLAVNVTSRRTIENVCEATNKVAKSFMYYVNDGVYGSFNCVLFDHAKVIPHVLRTSGGFTYAEAPAAVAAAVSEDGEAKEEDGLHECSIWGPTCDSIDLIVQKARLPELEVGDWIYFRNMGAYTLTAASTFNGFAKADVYYVPLR